jgi:hypothetical protein
LLDSLPAFQDLDSVFNHGSTRDVAAGDGIQIVFVLRTGNGPANAKPVPNKAALGVSGQKLLK